MIALEVIGLRLVGQLDDALGVLRRFDRSLVDRLGSGGNASEILLEDGNGFCGIDVTDNTHHHVAGDVVLVEEVLGVGGGKGLEVRVVTDGRTMIGTGSKRFGGELLD